jgi:AraC family ethanolamine operon transcriptional activator
MHQTVAASATPRLCADFDDLEQLCATVHSWDVDFRPLKATGKHGAIARIVQKRCGELELAYARLRVSIEQLGAPPAGTLTFGVLGPGTRRLWWRGRDVDGGTLLAFPVGAELRSISGPDFEVQTVSIAEEAVARTAERFQLSLPAPSRRPETFRPPAATLTALQRLSRQLLAPEIGNDSPEAGLLGDALVLAWLRAHSNTRDADARGSARQRDRGMRACLARLEHPDWPELTPSVLCDVGGVGERTLQYAFRERFGVTPAAFLKARRLAAVRVALRRAAPEQSVADIAAGFGFWHTGQFAADYRRAFGEPPSETLTLT